MPRPTVAFFCMFQRGHFQRMRPLVAALARRGLDAVVFTHREFAPAVEACGARFADLFAGRALPEAEDPRDPAPFRYIGFAAGCADDIVEQVARLRPALVAYDTFAVVGHVVGKRLGVPFVNVCAGHDVHPGRLRELLATVPRTAAPPGVRRAMERLAATLGIDPESPFAYLCALSPFLNVYAEPPEFLSPAERAAFEPLAFFGSIEAGRGDAAAAGVSSFPDGPADCVRVYVSFGTVTWRFYAAEAARALRAIAADLAGLPDVRALMSLGGYRGTTADLSAELALPNVRVATYVDQWEVLRESDVFVTHHGLNSTHEAIYHRVPMVSCPFIWDQPALARRCAEMGLAVPLVETPRAEVAPGRMRAALARVADERAAIERRLETARAWEDAVIAGRDRVVDRIVALAGST